MPFSSATTSAVNVYALSDALSRVQTLDVLWIAFVFGFVGFLLVEERTLVYLAGSVIRIGRARRARPRGVAENQ